MPRRASVLQYPITVSIALILLNHLTTPLTSPPHSPYTQTHTSYAPYPSLYTPPPEHEYCRSYPCHNTPDPRSSVQGSKAQKIPPVVLAKLSDGTARRDYADDLISAMTRHGKPVSSAMLRGNV